MDSEEMDMIPNGRMERVKFDERFKYIEQMKDKRIEEIRLQTEKIR